MAKRITSERTKTWAVGAGIVGVPLAVLLIWYLTTLGVIDITGISGDTICAGTSEDPCLAFVNFSVKEDIFIYPSEDWSSTPFYTDIQPESVEMYRSWGDYWRKIDLTKGCTGSWCGCYWCTTSNTAVFSYAFREGRDYELKYVALKNDPDDTIKWGFGPIDPFWYGINDTANISVSTSMSIELGSQINVTTNISGVTTVCVDIDHPEYGNEYACGTPNANFLFNISYFRKTELNDSSTSKTLNYSSAANNTIYIASHQYDEMYNFTINLTGILVGSDYPENVKIYINDTLDVSVGPLRPVGTDVYSNKTNSSSLPEFILDGINGTTTRYFDIPDGAVVSYGFINYTGDASGGDYSGCDNSGFCANATTNWTVCGDDSCTDEPASYDSFPGNYSVAYTQGATSKSTQIYLNFTNQTATPAYGTWRVKWRGWGDDNSDGQATRTTRFYVWDYLDDEWTLLLSRVCTENTPSALWCRTVATGGPYTETMNFYNTLTSTVFYPDEPVRFMINSTHSAVDANDETWLYVYEADTIFTTSVGHPNTTGMSWGTTTGTANNLTIEVGAVDGDYEGNYTGDLPWLVSRQTVNFSDELNSYMDTCVISNGYCTIPIYFTTPDGGGKIKIHDLNITYDYNPNPIQLSTSLVSSFLGNSTDSVDLPISIYSDSGNITIDDIRFDYAGGNDTIEILTYEFVDVSSSYQEDANTSVYPAFYLYVNYTKPLYANSNSTWQVKHGSLAVYNITSSESNFSSCWDYNETTLDLRIYSLSSSGSDCSSHPECYNGTWIRVGSEDRTTNDPSHAVGFGSVMIDGNWGTCAVWSDFNTDWVDADDADAAKADICEEAMIWNISSYNEYTNNETLDLINYYSDWDYTFPSYVDYLEFIPNSPTSVNVTPYGQTSNTPILNITTHNYGGMDMNFSMKINETGSCVNITWNATGSSKPSSGNIINTTWQNLATGLEYLNNTQIWFWADYSCTNQLNWTWWFPEMYFRGCGESVDVCVEDTS